jgi:hypothetical protein
MKLSEVLHIFGQFYMTEGSEKMIGDRFCITMPLEQAA